MPLSIEEQRRRILVTAAAAAARRSMGAMKLRISLEGKTYDVDVEVLPDAVTVSDDGEPETGLPETVLQPPLGSDIRPDDKIFRSPIAGMVISVQARAGHWVRKDEPVAVIEAMKMQTTIGAPLEGMVEEVVVSPGDAVKPGQVLCRVG